MSFLQPLLLIVLLPVIIHLIHLHRRRPARFLLARLQKGGRA